ncbi:hypothetical protein VTK26DRAFT_7080 [Humicola hyalothermophila]
MSPKLKPLLLPQLVEAKRKLEGQNGSDYACNSSSSDLASPSPIASTFSRTTVHSRFSASSSSLELPTPPCFDSPASPPQSVHVGGNSISLLPDVQEEPPEKEDGSVTAVVDDGYPDFGLYDCLCDASCSHQSELAQSPTIYSYMTPDFEYDLGFLSDDGDFNGNLRQKKKRHGSDAGFSTWSARLGSRLPTLSRWRSTSTSRPHDLTFSPSSDPALPERQPSFSHAALSRSSSISGLPRAMADRAHDSELPATPALSFYESSESVVIPSPLDSMPATLGRGLERERAIARTPLLPPLLIQAPASCQTQPPSLHASPLQSPSVAASPVLEAPAGTINQTPPLSSNPSLSSLRRGTISSTFSDAASPIPCFFDHQDPWSDRLGHANFTIEPKPYLPEKADLATLQSFRADWNLGRTNYAKHLVRTAEHYGSTSKTYALTEAKWAEIELEWQQKEDELIARVAEQCKDDPSVLSQLRRTAEDKPSPAIPRMHSDDGKFPELGDVEIVGPMERDTVMVRDRHHERRTSASIWLKNLAGKVGLRK